MECNVIGLILEAVVALSKNDQLCMYLRVNYRTAFKEWSSYGGCGGKDRHFSIRESYVQIHQDTMHYNLSVFRIL